MEKANNAYHLGLDLSEYAKARIRAADGTAAPKIIFTTLMYQRASEVSQVHSNLSHLICTQMMSEVTQFS